jgi:hypothetical protein
VLPSAMPVGSTARAALVAAGLVLALSWIGWPVLVRALGVQARPAADAAGVALLLVLGALALVVWALNPFTALLLVPALHLWLLLAAPELRPRRSVGLGLVALGLLLPALAIALHCDRLGLDPVQAAWTALLLVGGGQIGILGAALWSLALGCSVGAALLALAGRSPAAELPEITVRGPITYAGPGSLGGTESALRR